jgi:glutathione S-transferase
VGNVLVIGNKNYSSWSLRPWLYLAVHDIPFEERCIPLYGSGSREAILAYSDAGLVPVFLRDGLKVWDSLAILETLAELYPSSRGWPQDANERAWARAISAEMHAGFSALRTHLPMNLRRRIDPGELPEDVAAEVLRVRTLWHECRKAHPGVGPFLFGHFSIADAMYAPVVCRFETYGVKVGPLEREYMDAVLGLPAMRRWIEAAQRETEVIAAFER